MTSVVDQVAFRGALSCFASGVTVAATTVDGVDHAMTASAFTSVSLEPPLVLICSQKTSRFHGAVLRAGVWSISILAEESDAASTWFATKGRPLHDQFAQVPYHRGDLGTPLLDESLAWLECTTSAVHDGGDHTIIVGAVVGAGVSDNSDDPLLYYRSRYGTIVRSEDNEKTVRKAVES